MALAKKAFEMLASDGIPVCRYRDADVSDDQRRLLDQRIGEILEEARHRAATILRERRPLIETLRDLLVEKKVVDANTIAGVVQAG